MNAHSRGDDGSSEPGINLSPLGQLIAKQAISEVLYRYVRGVDRKDRDTFLSSYWSDAIDDHAGIFFGHPAELCDFIFASVADMTTMHFVSNMLIDLIGDDKAFCESYVSSHHIVASKTGPRELVGAGRYLDHLSRRGDEWRILRRTAIIEIVRDVPAQTELPVFAGLQMAGGTFPDDPLYAMRREVRTLCR